MVNSASNRKKFRINLVSITSGNGLKSNGIDISVDVTYPLIISLYLDSSTTSFSCFCFNVRTPLR